jgi:hypothetical protein
VTDLHLSLDEASADDEASRRVTRVHAPLGKLHVRWGGFARPLGKLSAPLGKLSAPLGKLRFRWGSFAPADEGPRPADEGPGHGERGTTGFRQGRESLGDLADEVTGVLNAAGFTVRGVRRTPAFARLHVESAEGGVEVDLVADPVPRIDAPESADASGVAIEIDSKWEISAHKLNALLSRSELRDLVDVEALMNTGLGLRSGLEGRRKWTPSRAGRGARPRKARGWVKPP